MQELSAIEFSQLRRLVQDWCGILVDDQKQYLVTTRLGPFARQLGCTSFGDFYARCRYQADRQLRERVIDLMTTNETQWFRDSHPFTVLREQLLPAYAREFADQRRCRLRLWSAACSTGQEPYSIAMTVLDAARRLPGLDPARVDILATDICASALRLASLGRYDRMAISRGLPEDCRDRWFRPDGPVWVLADEVKRMVRFRRFNLQDNFTELGCFDVIFCRNVAIYFAEDFKRTLFSRLGQALLPRGVLFLGASESLIAYNGDFAMRQHGRGLYYQLPTPSSKAVS